MLRYKSDGCSWETDLCHIDQILKTLGDRNRMTVSKRGDVIRCHRRKLLVVFILNVCRDYHYEIPYHQTCKTALLHQQYAPCRHSERL